MTITEPVVQQFISENLQNIEEKGSTIFATCPYCGKKKNHFNIYKNEGKYYFKCYSCNKTGTFEYLIKSILGWKVDVKKVVEGYSNGITLATLLQLYDKNVSYADMFFDWTEGTVPLNGKSLLHKQAIKYLESRNISLEEAEELGFRLGKEGKYKNMLVIPVYFEGEVANLVARRIPPYRGSRYDGPHKGEPPIPKAELLYNFDRAVKSKWVILVEGIFDAIALMQENLPVVALLGKQISSEQLLKVIENWSEVYVMLDSGFMEDAIEIGKKLQGLTERVKLCILPLDRDPSDDPEGAVESISKAKSIEFY